MSDAGGLAPPSRGDDEDPPRDDGGDDGLLSLTADMTPKELLQLAHTQARANANVKMQLF